MQPTPLPPTPSDNYPASPAAVASAQGKVMRPTPDLAEAMNRGYEPKDISLRGLFIFLFTLAGTLVVVLAVIYAIMMALLENDRSHDALGTPVSIARGDTYAPLQPSVGHPSEDWSDMLVMREQTQEILIRPKLARQMPIDQAIEKTVDLLNTGGVVHAPTVTAAKLTPYGYGSTEGHYAGGGLPPDQN